MPKIKSRLKRIELLVLDVDGVMTDGSIIYSDNGSETKIFNVKDGLGMRLLLEAGIQVCIITGRRSKALKHRCRNLGITHLFDGISDKAGILEQVLKKMGTTPECTAFVGDDLPDLKLMNRVGFSIAVADAHPVLQKNADMVTSTPSGAGAVREICEAILEAKGLWETILKRFL